MYKPKLSIILPSISPEKWANLYDQIKNSVGQFPFEVIAVGPFFQPTNPDLRIDFFSGDLIKLEKTGNFRFVRDFGSPSRCMQLGASIAQGEYITYLPDDSIVFENTYNETIKFFDTQLKHDGITILYSEGMGFSGSQHLDPNYWVAGTHNDLRLKYVSPEWKIAPIFMYDLEFFKKIGGLDCSFEHTNMNCHDLAFRVQVNGGRMLSSPVRVFASNWKPWGEPKGPIQRAYEENDAPLFKKLYDGEEHPAIRPVSFDNWRNADTFWKRRFSV